MAQLKFKEDDEGNMTKVAVGMYSKESEYVDFVNECDCTGQVWNNPFLELLKR